MSLACCWHGQFQGGSREFLFSFPSLATASPGGRFARPCRGGAGRRCHCNVDLSFLNLLAGLSWEVVDFLLCLQVEHDIPQLLLDLGDLQVFLLTGFLQHPLLLLQFVLQQGLVCSQAFVQFLLLLQLVGEFCHFVVQLGTPWREKHRSGTAALPTQTKHSLFTG